MKYKKYDSTIVVRLDKDDEIVSSIKKIAQDENINVASIAGIGGTDSFTVGVFDTSIHDYERFSYTGTHEITNLTGNITTMNGEKYVHLHMMCAGPEGKIVGGHLLNCTISLTAEIFINTIPSGIVERERNEDLQINVLKL